MKKPHHPSKSDRWGLLGARVVVMVMFSLLTTVRAVASDGTYDCFELSSHKALARMVVIGDSATFWTIEGRQFFESTVSGSGWGPGWYSFKGETTSGRVIDASIAKDLLTGSIRVGPRGRMLDFYASCVLAQPSPQVGVGKAPRAVRSTNTTTP